MSSELRRAIGPAHATALVVGAIVGASIFVQPSEITHLVPSVPGIVFVWLVCGGLTMIGALICAELSATFPETGGVYVYLSRTFGRPVGFLWGWAMFWSAHSGILATLGVVFARYLAYFVPLDDTGLKLVAIAAILIMSAVNYVGVQYGSGVQALVTAGKLLAIVAIVLLGLTLGLRLPAHFVGATAPVPLTASTFLMAVIPGLFTFGGWHQVTYTSGETRDPARTVPRALIWGTVIVTAIYVLLNLVYLFVLPLDKVAASTRIAADAAEALLGPGAGRVISGFVLFSVLGTLTALILVGPRVYFAMARDGIVFRWLGDVHPVYQTPHRAIVLQAVWASVLVATGTFRALFTRVTYTEWVFFGLLAVGLILLRRRPDVTREWRMWGAPALPAVFAAGSFAIVVNQIVRDPKESAIGLGLVLAGLPVYYLWGRRNAVRESKA